MNTINNIPLSGIYGHRTVVEPEFTPGALFPYHLGVELELESVRVPRREGGWEHWTVVSDDSLRNGREFIFNTPKRGTVADAAVTEFYARGVTSHNTARTSTHIHINVTDLKVGDVRAMYILSYALENALFNTINSKRKYCGYCMPLSEMSPRRTREFLCSTDTYALAEATGGPNADKYYGFNINSIRKHGTAELRYFPGGPSESDLRKWMAYACDLRTAAVGLGIAGLDAIESPEHFQRVIVEYFGSFGGQLAEAGGIDSMYAALQEVLGMLPEENVVRRNQRIVFLTPALAAFVGRHVLRDPLRIEHFHKTAMPLSAVSEDDWRQLLRTSSTIPSAPTTGEEEYQMSFGPIPPRVRTYMDYVRYTHDGNMVFGSEREQRLRVPLTDAYRTYLRTEAFNAERSGPPLTVPSSWHNETSF